jgi:hypothetical protein
MIYFYQPDRDDKHKRLNKIKSKVKQYIEVKTQTSQLDEASKCGFFGAAKS